MGRKHSESHRRPVARAVDNRRAVWDITELPEEVQDRLLQGQLVSHPRTRALWRRLDREQQKAVLAPDKAIGKSYPLTSGDLAKLTEIPEHRVRYWADKNIVPCWRRGRRRLFEVPGAITAFALRDSEQNEVQFYGEIMNEPAHALAAKLDLVVSMLVGRLEELDPVEAKGIVASLSTVGDAGYSTNKRSRGGIVAEQRHVTKEGDKWAVKKPGAERASSLHDTQRQADQRAEEILRNAGGGERVTHGRDGRIRSKDTISPGRDPNPPRDKEH